MGRMVKKIISQLILALTICTISHTSGAQNSVLVNFGRSSCTDSVERTFSFIKDPLALSPSSLITCSLANQLPGIFGVFIAYNPKNNKIYVADINTGNTKIWALDIGLPANISCPPVIDTL